MRLHHIHVRQEFAKPVDRIFAHLSEHENLSAVFAPARVERVRDGEDGHRNGVGSTRKLSFAGLMPFEETVTEFVEGERIVYRITKGSPLRGHEGVMAFSALPDGGTLLDYRIQLGSPVPGLAATVKLALSRSIARGLGTIDAKA
jgi:uncharacterized protein YndB with AHSA1/START domain